MDSCLVFFTATIVIFCKIVPDSAYVLVANEDGLSWSEANDYCASQIGRTSLATIGDATENAEAWSLCSTVASSSYGCWIGYNDIDVEGTWEWDSGDESTYTNWATYEPNGGTTENCACMWSYYSGGWVDCSCDSSAYLSAIPFLCDEYVFNSLDFVFCNSNIWINELILLCNCV